MALPTGSGKRVFDSVFTVDNSPSAVANNAFSDAADVNNFTNSGDAPTASVTFSATFVLAPTLGSVVNLYARLMAFDGSQNAEIPTANYPNIYLGSFPLKTVTSLQHAIIEVALPSNKTGQVYQLYYENKSGQSIPAGWAATLTPQGIGPA